MSKIIVTQVQGSITSPVLTLPTTNPSANNLVQSDASGNLSFTGAPSVTSLTASGTVSGSGLVAPTIRSTPSTTNFTLPTTDGASGQVLQTNGSGVLSFGTPAASLSGTTNPTTSTVAVAGTPYINTRSGEVFVCMGTRVVSSVTIYMWEGLSGTNVGIPQGQVVFGTSTGGTGSTTWTVPADVYQVSAVCIGGGGGGYNTWASGVGNGGALAYATFAVTPGQVLTVVVGAGGTGGSSPTAGGNTYIANATPTTLFTAQGGLTTSTTRATPVSGSITCYGGAGGINYNGSQGGGGGAGGYGTLTTGLDGIGGDGPYGDYTSQANIAFANSAAGSLTLGLGQNGGGGGGTGYYSSTYGFGGGGGTGIYGRGSNGIPGLNAYGNNQALGNFQSAGGFGGSNGERGAGPYTGLAYLNGRQMYGSQGGWPGGGGGGGGTSSNNTTPYSAGANGAIRIVWGLSSRQYPNYVPDLATIA